LLWQVVPSGTPTTQGTVQISALFTSTVGQESPLFIAAATTSGPSNSAATYKGFGGGPTSWTTTEYLASSIFPVGGKIDKLNVVVVSAPGANASYSYVLYQNGSPTNLGGGASCVAAPGTGACTCVISGALTKTCSDTTTAAIAISATDTISLAAIPCGTLSTPSCTGALTSSSLGGSLRWVPTTTNQALLFQLANTMPATTSTHYMNVNGSGQDDTTETNTYNITPLLTTHMTMRNLTVAQCPGPGASARTRQLLLRANGGTPASEPTLTVGSGSTACPTLTTAQDTTDTYVSLPGDLLDLSTVASATANTALTTYKTSMSVTVP
jgi:hypothetical protein